MRKTVRSHLLFGLALLCLVLSRVAEAFLTGDVNCDGNVDGQDVDALVVVLFGDGANPVDCPEPDANDDGISSAADIVGVLLSLQPPGTPTPSPTPATGPQIAYFGLAAADGTVIAPEAQRDGTAVFQRPGGSGFQVVVEAIPGTAGLQVGTVVFDPRRGDPQARPDLQIEASRPLGDGDPAVCTEGGIRGFDPPDFGETETVADALNDFGCGFEVATTGRRACTINEFGSSAFVSQATGTVQFCLLVNAAKALPTGATTLTVIARDVGGNVGPEMHMIVRIGNDPLPTETATRTFTPTPTTAPRSPTPRPSPSSTPRPSTTGTRLATPTPTATGSPGFTPSPSTTVATATRTSTAVPSPTPSASVTGTRPTSTPTATGSRSPSSTLTVTPSRTRSATPPRTITSTRTSTPTPTVTRTPTLTRTPTATRSFTTTRTPTNTPTITKTPTVTPTPTITLTPTATVPPEPIITFFGLAFSDGTLGPQPSGATPDGIPIYQRPTFGFWIVVEGHPALTRVPLGNSTYNWSPDDPTVLPDLQIEVSSKLGNGSIEVCDDNPPNMVGGVPAVDPPDFSAQQSVANAINDFACRFQDGAGNHLGRTKSDACTIFPPEGDSRFVNSTSTIQFCGLIDKPFGFQAGESTVVTVRIRDTSGHLSDPAQLIIQVPAP